MGVFDSGLGGISVLRTLRDFMPEEHFIYYGDSANAPYGGREAADIRRLTLAATENLTRHGIKALLVACNTATSAAVQTLRERFSFPVIGMEPALKPAAAKTGSRVLVMATESTLGQEKFARLLAQWGTRVQVTPLPCPGLVERIEAVHRDGPELQAFLHRLLAPYAGRTDAVVLGCTHYPFVRREILQELGPIPVFDGREGTAKQLDRQLRAGGLRRTCGTGDVVLLNSRADHISLSEQLLQADLP